MYNDNFFGQYLVIIPDEVKIKIVSQSVNWEKLEHFAIFLQYNTITNSASAASQTATPRSAHLLGHVPCSLTVFLTILHYLSPCL